MNGTSQETRADGLATMGPFPITQRHRPARVLLPFSSPGRMWDANGKTPRGAYEIRTRQTTVTHQLRPVPGVPLSSPPRGCAVLMGRPLPGEGAVLRSAPAFSGQEPLAEKQPTRSGPHGIFSYPPPGCVGARGMHHTKITRGLRPVGNQLYSSSWRSASGSPSETNPAMSRGVAESNPTTSIVPASSGSAMLNPLDTIPTTTSFAGMPV